MRRLFPGRLCMLPATENLPVGSRLQFLQYNIKPCLPLFLYHRQYTVMAELLLSAEPTTLKASLLPLQAPSIRRHAAVGKAVRR